MLRKKLTRLVSGTIVMSMIFSTMAQAKPNVPNGASAIMGDTYLPSYGAGSAFNLTQQMVDRGFSGKDLDIIYSQQQGPNRNYYNLNDYYDTKPEHKIGDNKTTPEIWNKVKYKFDASANGGRGKIVPIDDVSDIATTTIQVRKGFTSFIKLENNVIKLSNEVAFSDLKNMIEATDKSNQVYSAKLGNEEISDATTLVAGNTYNLTVTAEDGKTVDSTTYTIEVSQSGGGDVTLLPTPTFTDDGNLSTEPMNLKVGDADVTLAVKATAEGASETDITYKWYSIGEEQDIPSANLLKYYDLPESNLVGEGKTFKFTPSKVGTTYYFATAINGEGQDGASKAQSNLATVIVTEGDLSNTEFTVNGYVYNDESKDTKTMGKLTGTARKDTKITIEANFTTLATIDMEADGDWEATFPRQNAGTVIRVTATLNGKSSTENITVEAASTEDLEAFRKSIDLNKLIEVRDNLHVSEDGKDVSNGYWIKSQTEADAFKAYVNLIEAVLGYKYQISTVDLDYVQNIALSTLKTYEDKIHQAGEVSTKATVSISRDGKGTVEVLYKDDSHSVTDGVYKVEADKGTSVTFTAKADTGNHFVKWVVDGNDDTTSGATLTKEVKADMSVKAVFAKDGEQPIEEVIVTTKAENGKITARKADDNTPITIGADGTFKVEKGTEVVFVATADDDYKFNNWLVNNVDAGKENTITRTITDTMTVEAKFDYVPVEEGKSRVTTVATNGKIVAEANGTSITIGTDGTFDIDDNTEVKFTATADEGYKFKNWLINDNDIEATNPLTKTITANTKVEAIFEKDGGSSENKEMNLTLSPSTYESITVGKYVYTEVTAAGKNASDFDIELTVPSNKVTATYVNGEIAIGGVSVSDSSIEIGVKATATGYKDGTGTITVKKVENPKTDKTEIPVIEEYKLTLIPSKAKITGYENIIAQVTGTAEAGAVITLKDAAGNAIATEDEVVTGSDNKWTAILKDRLDGGTKVVAIAELEGKLPSETSAEFEVKLVSDADTKPMSDLVTEIDNRLKSVVSSTKGDGSDVTADNTIKEYLPKTEYEAITILRDLLKELLNKQKVSVQDIEFVKGDVRNAWDLTEKNIKPIPSAKTNKLTLLVGGNKQGTVTIEDKDAGAIVGDTSSVTNGVYTINSGKTVTITAIPNASNEVAGWLIDEKPSVETDKTTRELTVTKDTSVQAIFASTQEASKVTQVIEKVSEITSNGTKPVEVSTSKAEPTVEEVKTLVEAEIKSKIPEDATIEKIELEEIPTRAINKNYKATVTFKVGNVTFTITIDISVKVEENVSDVELTLEVTSAENGNVLSVKQDGADVSSQGKVYTVKSGKEVTFTVEPKPDYKATWSSNVTPQEGNVVTITPTASETIALNFEPISKENKANIKLNVTGNGLVKVTSNDKDMSSLNGVYTVTKGSLVTFEAMPIGNTKVEWPEGVVEVDKQNLNKATLTANEDKTLNVVFSDASTENTSSIILNVDGNGTKGAVKVEVDGTSLTANGNVYTVENGKTVTFTAIPKADYKVKTWTGATVDNTVTDKTVATLQVSANSTVGVEFELKNNNEKEDTVKVLVRDTNGNYTSVSAEVYDSSIDEKVSFTVNNAVYSIYAQVSNVQAEFSIPDNATNIDISFDMNVTKTVNNSVETLTDVQIKEILKHLQISSNRRTYTTPTLSDNNKKLNVTLDLDTMKTSANEVNDQSATTIEFSYNGMTTKNKPLKFGAYKFKK